MAIDMNGPLLLSEASAAYDVLVAHAGEVEEEWSRSDFVYRQSTNYCGEYRFQGALGFGGKFRRGSIGLYVDCYREDLTPERAQMIADTNKALAAL